MITVLNAVFESGVNSFVEYNGNVLVLLLALTNLLLGQDVIC